jgi:hypothetical protein
VPPGSLLQGLGMAMVVTRAAQLLAVAALPVAVGSPATTTQIRPPSPPAPHGHDDLRGAVQHGGVIYLVADHPE